MSADEPSIPGDKYLHSHYLLHYRKKIKKDLFPSVTGHTFHHNTLVIPKLLWHRSKKMINMLKLLFSWRFFKFCIVGASGVCVNMVILALLADLLSVQTNLAAAIAIEISINTNFVINEYWTFQDRRTGNGAIGNRWFQFHLVSFGGAVIQWCLFVCANMVWVSIIDGPTPSEQYFDSSRGFFDTYIWGPIIQPPDVGNFKYISQLIGIGVATLWNFFVNFFWTWKKKKKTG
jgi:putative flippase GtrA